MYDAAEHVHLTSNTTSLCVCVCLIKKNHVCLDLGARDSSGLCFFVFVFEIVFIHSLGCSGTHYLCKVGLKLREFFLPLSS